MAKTGCAKTWTWILGFKVQDADTGPISHKQTPIKSNHMAQREGCIEPKYKV